MTYEMTLIEREWQKAEEIALNLIKEGITFDFIHKVTKLPVRDIEELAEKSRKSESD